MLFTETNFSERIVWDNAEYDADTHENNVMKLNDFHRRSSTTDIRSMADRLRDDIAVLGGRRPGVCLTKIDQLQEYESITATQLPVRQVTMSGCFLIQLRMARNECALITSSSRSSCLATSLKPSSNGHSSKA